jgi:DNA-binding NarL/FixJ family response regulator
VNQDEVKLREIPSGEKFLDSYDEKSGWNWVASETHLTPKESAILMLIGMGLTRADVCQLLKITRHQLCVHIQNMKGKVPKP